MLLLHCFEIVLAALFVLVFYPRELDGGVSLIANGVPSAFDWESTQTITLLTEFQNTTISLFPNAAPKSCELLLSLIRDENWVSGCQFELYGLVYLDSNVIIIFRISLTRNYGVYDKLACSKKKVATYPLLNEYK
jgi:hypothetical protein